MLFGPVFTREVVIAPRRTRIYIARSAYAAALLLLICTAWLVLTGTQIVRDVGDLAQFAGLVFQILAPLQLALAVFFSAMLAASAVAQEKDRRTFVLLLLTNLSNQELVLGKLLASLLHVLVMFAAGLPVFMLLSLLGGISVGTNRPHRGRHGGKHSGLRQPGLDPGPVAGKDLSGPGPVRADPRSLAGPGRDACGRRAGTLARRPACPRLGNSRQSLAGDPCGLAALHAVAPRPGMARLADLSVSVVATALAVLLNGLAVFRVRAWNASGQDEAMRKPEEAQQKSGKRRQGQKGRERDWPPPFALYPDRPLLTSSHRAVWDNPVLWREIRTWAYGQKILIVRITFLVLFALAAGNLWRMINSHEGISLARGALALLPMLLLSLVLVNAQAVTALTAERDTKALDLLLVSDLTPKEFVFGKLGGIFYNTKEIVLLPMLLCGYLGWQGESAWRT